MGHSLGQSLDSGLKLLSGLPLIFYLNEPGICFSTISFTAQDLAYFEVPSISLI